MLNLTFPDNLSGLHTQEQALRHIAAKIAEDKPKLLLHLNLIERVMSLSKIMVDYPTEDEDFKVAQMLSIRMFNAFGASLMLMFSGYHQNSGLVMRDTLETLFLLDLFRTDRTAIERWRFADEKQQRGEFSPVAVRKFLDERDGFKTKKREEAYKMFCKLAAHPNMHSQHMLKPEKGGDIVTGPFMEATALEAGISELGRMAIQAGEIIDSFLPDEWNPDAVRTSFAVIKREWIQTFYKHLADWQVGIAN